MAFKMKKFSGFGNSPLKNDKKKQPTVKEDTAKLDEVWKNTKQYKRLVAAGAPDEAIQKAKEKWGSGSTRQQDLSGN